MLQRWKILTLIGAVIIVSGCSLRRDNIAPAQTQDNAQTTAAVVQLPVGNLDDWQTLTREKDGFTIRYPQTWWWQRDAGKSGSNEVQLLIGFAPTEDGLVEGEDYPIEFLVAGDDVKWRYDGFLKTITTKDDKQYVLRGAPQYRDIINAMAESFEFLSEEVDTSDWQTYRNEEYGYEISYPKDLFTLDSFFDPDYKVDSKNVALFHIPSSLAAQECKCGESELVSVSILTNPDNSSLQEFQKSLKRQYSLDFVMYEETKEFKGKPAVYFGTEREDYIVFENGNVIFQLYGHGGDFQNIISTFKFIK